MQEWSENEATVAPPYSSEDHEMFELLHYDWISKALATDPLTGNVTYLMVALFTLVYTSLNLFMYKTDAATLALGDVAGKTNFFKTGLYIEHYFKMVFWSLSLVTQILSMFGIGNSINAIMWSTGQTLVRFFDILINLVTARSKADGKTLTEENVVGSALYLQGKALLAMIEANKFENAIGARVIDVLITA